MLKKNIQQNEWNKLKNRKSRNFTLPEPPKEASDNLRQIEIPYSRKYTPRYMKRTDRVIQFATRVTPEFDKQIREISKSKNVYLAEVLEEMLNTYLEVNKDNNNHRERERERERAKKDGNKSFWEESFFWEFNNSTFLSGMG